MELNLNRKAMELAIEETLEMMAKKANTTKDKIRAAVVADPNGNTAEYLNRHVMVAYYVIMKEVAIREKSYKTA